MPLDSANTRSQDRLRKWQASMTAPVKCTYLRTCGWPDFPAQRNLRCYDTKNVSRHSKVRIRKYMQSRHSTIFEELQRWHSQGVEDV